MKFRQILHEEIARTRRQREVLQFFEDNGAISAETAIAPFGSDSNVTDKLAMAGILNTINGHKFWIRNENEEPTKLYRTFIFYSKGDKFIMVICRYPAEIGWSTILEALRNLAKRLGFRFLDAQIDGIDMNTWDIYKKQRKFDFIDGKFLEVSVK